MYELLSVDQGIPSPPSSPPLAARHASTAKNGKARRGGAAYTITEECERLFCETLRSVFLGEGSQHRQDSLVMGMSYVDTIATTAITNDYGIDVRRYSDSSTDSDIPEMVRFEEHKGAITNYIEMWDYVGGVMFRGFVVEREEERSMFVFFDEAVIGADLKAGLMALLELCEIDYFSCSHLVLCIDRHSDQVARNNLTKDLGWIGFGLTTLDDFSQGENLTSDKWLFMDMEV